jgi:hypothetical protein
MTIDQIQRQRARLERLEKLQKHGAFWAKVLQFEDWDVHYELVSYHPGGAPTVITTREIKSATIIIRDENGYLPGAARPFDLDIDRIIVRSLLHIALDHRVQTDESTDYDVCEFCEFVEGLSTQIVKLWRGEFGGSGKTTIGSADSCSLQQWASENLWCREERV